MAGRIIYRPHLARECASPSGCPGKPNHLGLDHGTIWQCDECEQQWVLVMGAQYNETYWAWRKLTAQNRNGVE